MAQQVLEGIGAELIHHLERFGHEHFRLVPLPKPQEKAKPKATEQVAQPKQLRGRGSLAGVLNTEDFLRRKHEDTLKEDRPLR